MRSRKLAGLLVGALLFVPAALCAGDPAPGGKNWSLSVGLKGWYNDWSTTLARYDTEGGNQIAVQSEGRFSVIPNIAWAFNEHWSVSGSYFANTSYDFDTVYDVYDFGGSAYYETITTSAKRKEWDVHAWYHFNKHFRMGLGYKEIDKDITSSRAIPGFTFFENPLRKQKASGVVLTMMGSGALTEGGKVQLYAVTSLGSLNQKTQRPDSTDYQYCHTPPYANNIYCNPASFSENQWYNNLEAGFVFAPHTVPFTYTLGYRYQSMRGNNKIQDTSSTGRAFSLKSSDVIRGFTFGVSYRF